MLPDHVSRGANHHTRVPDGVTVRRVALQDGREDDHREAARQALAEARGGRVLGRLGKLAPLALARAEGEWHGPRLLQAQDVAPGLARGRGQALDARKGGVALLGKRGGGRQGAGVLDQPQPHDARLATLLARGVASKGVGAQVKGGVGRGGVAAAAVGHRVLPPGQGAAARGERLAQVGRGAAVQHAHGGVELARGEVGGEEVLEPVVAGEGAVVVGHFVLFLGRACERRGGRCVRGSFLSSRAFSRCLSRARVEGKVTEESAT
jgi:hypothetical protein